MRLSSIFRMPLVVGLSALVAACSGQEQQERDRFEGLIKQSNEVAVQPEALGFPTREGAYICQLPPYANKLPDTVSVIGISPDDISIMPLPEGEGAILIVGPQKADVEIHKYPVKAGTVRLDTRAFYGPHTDGFCFPLNVARIHVKRHDGFYTLSVISRDHEISR